MATYDGERTLEPVSVHDLSELGVHESGLLDGETLERLLKHSGPSPGLEEPSITEKLDKLVDEPGSHVLSDDHLEDDVLAVLGGDDGLELGPGS